MKKVEITDRRYPIGKFEYGQKYKIEDTRKHIRYLAKFPSELKKTVKKLDRDELDSSYRKGGWTVRQVIHHLADSHLNAYIRTKLAVTEQTPIIKPYEEQLWAETEDGKHGSVKMSLKLLAALHRRWMEFLESLSDDDLERGYFHPASGRVMLMQEVIALYVWHSQHHLAHIRLVADGETEKVEKAAKPAKFEKTKAEKAAEKAAPAEDSAPAAKRGTPINLSRSNIKSAAAPPAEGKRVRRTKAQLAADKAAEAAAKEAKAAAKATEKAAAAAEKAAKPPIDRAAIMAKARAARQANLAAAAGEAVAAAPKEKKSAAKSAKAAPAAEPGKRVRRTQDQIAADKAAEVAAKASAKEAKAAASAAKKAAEKSDKPPVDRAAIMAKARAARQANLAAASGNAAAVQEQKAPAKPAKSAASAAKKAAEKSDKPPVDRAAIMAKARAARQANLAAAATAEAQQAKKAGTPTAPKGKEAAAKSAEAAESGKRVRRTQEQIAADKAAAAEAKAAAKVAKKAAAKAAKKSGDAPKRQGMSAEHMARIREAGMAKRAADIAAGLIPPPKPKVERDPNAPKLDRAAILEKARASRMANIAAKKAEANKA